MYSAFSERSPSAAAAPSARTTSGRRTFHRSLSSSRRRSKPARVTIAVEPSAGGRQRDTRTSALAPAEDAAEHAAHDRAPEPGRDAARRRLRRRLDHALAALVAPQEVV